MSLETTGVEKPISEAFSVLLVIRIRKVMTIFARLPNFVSHCVPTISMSEGV